MHAGRLSLPGRCGAEPPCEVILPVLHHLQGGEQARHQLAPVAPPSPRVHRARTRIILPHHEPQSDALTSPQVLTNHLRAPTDLPPPPGQMGQCRVLIQWAKRPSSRASAHGSKEPTSPPSRAKNQSWLQRMTTRDRPLPPSWAARGGRWSARTGRRSRCRAPCPHSVSPPRPRAEA
jgi:hypothetical protein